MKTFIESALNSFHCDIFSRQSRSAQVKMLLSSLGAFLFLLVASIPALAQNTYTWTSSTTGGTWITSGNWTETPGSGGFPGNASTDLAVLGNATANRIVTLNASESINTLTFTQTSGFINELDFQGAGAAAATLTVANTISLGATGGGTSRLYLDDSNSANAGNAILAANVNIGSGGILEMGAYANPGGVKNAPNVTGNVDVQSGGLLNIDQDITSFNGSSISGNLTLESSGTLYMGTANSGGVTVTTGVGIRFADSGTFLAKTGSAINVTGTPNSSTNPYGITFSGTSATFQSGVTGTFITDYASTGESVTFSPSGTSGTVFTLQSDVNLPLPLISPSGITSNTINMNLGTVEGTGTLTVSGLGLEAPQTAAANYNGTLELTLTSNVSIGTSNIVKVKNGNAGQTFIINTNGFTFDESGYGLFSTIDINNAASNWTLEGGGTIKGKNINLGGTGSNGASVIGATTLLAIGSSTANTTSNLSNAAGTIDPLSTFEYTGASAGGTENFLTSTRAIGRLLVASPAADPLGISGATLTVGGDVTVNSLAILDLGGQSLTETHGATATAGGLNGAGTVENGTATTTATASGTAVTLTLDTTQGNGSFSGVIKDNAAGTGTVALTKVGSGTQILSGTNNYTGATTVSGGVLDFAKAASLYNSAGGSLSTTNAAKVSVANGATVALGVGAGTTYLTSADITTVLGNTSFASGANLGIDTTNATSGAFTYASSIGNPGGNLGLVKLGTGALTLSNSSGSTYTGGTSVTGGTLVVTNTSNSATGTGALSVARGAAMAGTGTSSGTSFAIGGTSGSGTASVYVGQTAATGDTNTTKNLTLIGSGASTIANANLTFNLNTTAGGGNELMVGGTGITFGSGTAGDNPVTLTLNLQGGGTGGSIPYFVLIAGTAGNGTLASTQYAGLSFGTQFAADGGFLTPILNSTVGGSGNLILALNLNGSPNFYGGQAGLYLFQTAAGIDDIVVIPEPSTWALMLGGLAVLVFWQRRKSKS